MSLPFTPDQFFNVFVQYNESVWPMQNVLNQDLVRDAAPGDRELEREPDHWFWALEAITQENPVPPEAAGRVAKMAEAWIAWGKQQGYLAA